MNEEYILQNGISPCAAKPAENVTACCSAMPTSNARVGIFSIIIFIEEPDGIAGVMPTILSFYSASSTIVLPNTSWYFGACGVVYTLVCILPVNLSNLPGACH